MTGLSRSTAWIVTKASSTVGLIKHSPNAGGSRRTSTYLIADIRRPKLPTSRRR